MALWVAKSLSYCFCSLANGLQSRISRFDSGLNLHSTPVASIADLYAGRNSKQIRMVAGRPWVFGTSMYCRNVRLGQKFFWHQDAVIDTVHSSLAGHTVVGISFWEIRQHVTLEKFAGGSHCRNLVQLPMAV